MRQPPSGMDGSTPELLPVESTKTTGPAAARDGWARGYPTGLLDDGEGELLSWRLLAAGGVGRGYGEKVPARSKLTPMDQKILERQVVAPGVTDDPDRGHRNRPLTRRLVTVMARWDHAAVMDSAAR